jgi:tryptophan synthase alpha chain
VLGGFGIRTGEQARAVAPYVHAVVAGSVFVDAIRAVLERDAQGAYGSRDARDEAIRTATKTVAAGLTGRPVA